MDWNNNDWFNINRCVQLISNWEGLPPVSTRGAVISERLCEHCCSQQNLVTRFIVILFFQPSLHAMGPRHLHANITSFGWRQLCNRPKDWLHTVFESGANILKQNIPNEANNQRGIKQHIFEKNNSLQKESNYRT